MAHKKRFEDPAHKLWVWVVFIVLLAAMPPVWPVSGTIFGIPTWAIGAVAVSCATSGFICYVIFKVWHDPNDEPPSKRKSGL